jgi:predicted small secreted protein
MRLNETDTKHFRNILALLTISVGGFALTGCNTTEGVGEDIKAVGESIDDAAEDAND